MRNGRADTAPDANIGRQLLEQYVLVDKIGEGGMGAVYLADQPTMGRQAVVKLLHPALSRDSRWRRASTSRRARRRRSTIRTSSPSTTTARCPTASLYLAMEHLDGRDLERTIEESGRLSPARAVHVGAADLRGARRGARARRRASRSEAVERDAGDARARRRVRQGARLRHRQGARRGADLDGDDLRHARVHEPRAAPRRARSTGAAISTRSAWCCSRC